MPELGRSLPFRLPEGGSAIVDMEQAYVFVRMWKHHEDRENLLAATLCLAESAASAAWWDLRRYVTGFDKWPLRSSRLESMLTVPWLAVYSFPKAESLTLAELGSFGKILKGMACQILDAKAGKN